MTEAQKQFVFTWTIENYSFLLEKTTECLNSPIFVICDKSEWLLSLYPRGSDNERFIGCYLVREGDNLGNISVGFKLQIVNGNSIWFSATKERVVFNSGRRWGFPNFVPFNAVHITRRAECLPNDTLTLRCRMWKADGSFPEAGQCLARTHIKTETLAFLWCIQNFSAESSSSQKTVFIQSTSNPERTLALNLVKDNELIAIHLTVDNNDTRQILVCEFSLLGRTGTQVTSSKIEIRLDPEVHQNTWEASSFNPEHLFFRKRYLRNDILNIQCRITISNGVKTEHVLEYVHEYEMTNEQNVLVIHGDKKWDLQKSASTDLKHDFLLMNQKDLMSIVTLQTISDFETESFSVHASLLCAISPVFEKMFTIDMREKTTRHVLIEDLNSITVRRFLMYIYSNAVENLDLKSAQELYYASDKYQVFSLRKKCATFIMTQVTETNVCDILVLADRHQDECFKKAVINFIIDRYQTVVTLNWREWRSFADQNDHLAAEVENERLLELQLLI